jgi:hypothetical protein
MVTHPKDGRDKGVVYFDCSNHQGPDHPGDCQERPGTILGGTLRGNQLRFQTGQVNTHYVEANANG